jgi:hypothetical protein
MDTQGSRGSGSGGPAGGSHPVMVSPKTRAIPGITKKTDFLFIRNAFSV